MKTLRLCLCLFLAALLLGACQPKLTPLETPVIQRRPAAASLSLRPLAELPVYDPAAEGEAVYQIDLASADLTALDLRDRQDDLLYADFSTRTGWPEAAKMPSGFDPQAVLELGRSPGLGLRTLHGRGITGQGVGLAIIDQPLLVDHQEYAGQLRLYQEIGIPFFFEAQMHGPAVASLAVGKTVGVAPEADLYYVATMPFKVLAPWERKLDFHGYARAVRRIIEVNRGLPEGREIRVISLSIGWNEGAAGYEEMEAAVQAAKKAGIFVISSSLKQTYGFRYDGLGRAPLAEPDEFESYEPGLFWAPYYFRERPPAESLMVPMDSRTTASPTGPEDYTFFRIGGWSWVSPYLAGMYALAVQVDPAVTPEEFWTAAMETGRTITLEHAGEQIPFGPTLDPVALIERLEAEGKP